MVEKVAEQIEELHRQLNAAGRLPEKYYRRNTMQYELVSYLAAMVALWTSKNLPVLQLFLSRASATFDRLRPELETDYAELVDKYLRIVAEYLASSSDLTDDLKSLIPMHLLEDR
jgi:hypothetical protein